MRLARRRRQASAHGLRPAIAGRGRDLFSYSSHAVLLVEAWVCVKIQPYFASHSWSIRMYHCGFHAYPLTFLDKKSICLGLYMSTQAP
jgi:hypothetical protein